MLKKLIGWFEYTGGRRHLLGDMRTTRRVQDPLFVVQAQPKVEDAPKLHPRLPKKGGLPARFVLRQKYSFESKFRASVLFSCLTYAILKYLYLLLVSHSLQFKETRK